MSHPPCVTPYDEGVELKVTFFTGSVVGYAENPSALPTRGLAHGLALRGNDIRIVEARQNQAFVRTLREHGSEPSRHFHNHFDTIQFATYEPRSGAPLLEWTTREVALIDIAVAVAGLDDELCQWIANISRDGLTRAYLTWDPATLTDAEATRLQLDRFDVIVAPSQPAAEIPWLRVPSTLAAADAALATDGEDIVDPIDSASAFERIFLRRPRLTVAKA
jgi:hypothetical protein